MIETAEAGQETLSTAIQGVDRRHRPPRHTMSQEVLSISRDGQKLGNWKPDDVARMLEAGILSMRDLFWKEGMDGWTTLDQFAPSKRPPEVFPVTFGSRFVVDQLRFVGSCEVLVSPAGVEFVGKRLWPGWARLLAFVAGTPVVFLLVTALGHVLLRWEREGDNISFAVVLHFFVLLLSFIGSPLIVFTAMNYFCATQSSLRVERSAITGLTRGGPLGVVSGTAQAGRTPPHPIPGR